MNFILQADNVCLYEKSSIRHASMLAPAGAFAIHSAYLRDIELGRVSLSRFSVPVGTVEFCRSWMRACSVVEPDPLDYPTYLWSYLGREVHLYDSYTQAPDGFWVKPVRTKVWEAHIKGASNDQLPLEIDFNAPVWASNPVSILAEWHAYILRGTLRGLGRYDDSDYEIDLSANHDLLETLHGMISAYEASGEAPAAYALDVALTRDSRLILIEVTDAWAIGYYRGSCKPLDYANMLAARWHQIISI